MHFQAFLGTPPRCTCKLGRGRVRYIFTLGNVEVSTHSWGPCGKSPHAHLLSKAGRCCSPTTVSPLVIPSPSCRTGLSCTWESGWAQMVRSSRLGAVTQRCRRGQRVTCRTQGHLQGIKMGIPFPSSRRATIRRALSFLSTLTTLARRELGFLTSICTYLWCGWWTVYVTENLRDQGSRLCSSPCTIGLV